MVASSRLPTLRQTRYCKLASLYSSHPVLADFSLLLIVKKELVDLTLTQETFLKYLVGVTMIEFTQTVSVVYWLV